MDYSIYFQYVDELSINAELMCKICQMPFSDPVCTKCEHIFCRKCITTWMKSGKRDCPTCRREVLSTRSFGHVIRPLLNMLDELPVLCTLCKRSRIKRENFRFHIDRECPKFKVSCPAKEITCSWTGLREQLNAHKVQCVFLPFHSIIKQLMEKNQQLENQIKTQNARINKLEAEIKTKYTKTEQSINDLNSKCNHFVFIYRDQFSSINNVRLCTRYSMMKMTVTMYSLHKYQMIFEMYLLHTDLI